MSLLNELQILGMVIDKESQQDPHAALMSDKPSCSNSKLKGKNKKKNKLHKVPGANGGVAKPKGKCYYCKQPGHCKKQYPDYIAKMQKQGTSFSYVVETFLAVVSS
ncbi:uncharacterized protein LOC107844430 [Capsicum annuum]|uniref:uncharacterized protein LOC107844430 n=1 Tax=Capsicum annuum TaxID=4072 RepID=UPI0007BEDEA6|nr:uncharacterized protein LOC107844430 [Capsicum annuum]